MMGGIFNMCLDLVNLNSHNLHELEVKISLYFFLFLCH